MELETGGQRGLLGMRETRVSLYQESKGPSGEEGFHERVRDRVSHWREWGEVRDGE